MLIDLRADGSVPDLHADVCVIGAGAAGISVTRRLCRAGHRVILLEAGGLDYDADTQNLNDGANVGMPYYDLVDARLRFFGGTTNIWGGRCTPLEPIDFERRPWVRHSGWPLTFDDLLPYYLEAHRDLELGDFGYDQRLWRLLGRTPPPLTPDALITRFWRFDTVKERFSPGRCRDLFDAATVTVLTHANVVHLQANAHASALEHVRVSTLEGRTVEVRARCFVLACGGIENPRLLLAANDVERQGIGNRHDLVGRFFMEHQHGRAGKVLTARPFELWNLFRKRAPGRGQPPIAPTLLPAPALQARRGILNTALTFKLQRSPEQGLSLNDRVYRRLKHQLPPDRSRRRLWHAYRSVRGALQRSVKPVVERLRARGARHLYVMVRAEQSPNPASRVVLGSERDALGVPRAALDWQLSRQDKDTVAVLAETLNQEFIRIGHGGMEPAAWLAEPGSEWPVDATVSKHPIGGYHHMGTTRMSDDPAHGVVDGDCRVHGYGNLYVAGSSVFTTGGWANPTLTILALAYRLADRIDRQLRAG
ncbi:MAG: GMC family oxidoreductase [Pseudomonadales bacterium]